MILRRAERAGHDTAIAKTMEDRLAAMKFDAAPKMRRGSNGVWSVGAAMAGLANDGRP